MTLSANRLCLFAAAIFLGLAGFIALGVLHIANAEAFALFGFAFWAVADAV